MQSGGNFLFILSKHEIQSVSLEQFLHGGIQGKGSHSGSNSS